MLSSVEKLAILADAAKYDASCASSAAAYKDSAKTGGIGSTGGMGICHSYAPDGRCISLLKVLFTNFCVYDCLYCVNRRSSSVRRAQFRVEELVQLTLEFYRRNYIEGLFLSSGIARSPDDTMERLIGVARELRVTHKFQGYIHLKSIPDAAPELLETAARYADRLSLNIELPTATGLKHLAPEKSVGSIHDAMGHLRRTLEEHAPRGRPRRAEPRAVQATSQSTQMIVGADGAHDADILATSRDLYQRFSLKRVYYSAYSPTQDLAPALPTEAPPLLREHRLYQADWLLRFYGFSVGEITGASVDGMLELEIDPKLAWALANRQEFPVDVNRAPRRALLRVPGLGTRSVARILQSRRHHRLSFADIVRLCGNSRKVRPFIETRDWQPGELLDSQTLRQAVIEKPRQHDLFTTLV